MSYISEFCTKNKKLIYRKVLPRFTERQAYQNSLIDAVLQLTPTEYEHLYLENFKDSVNKSTKSLLSNESEGYKTFKILTKYQKKSGLVDKIQINNTTVVDSPFEVAKILLDNLPSNSGDPLPMEPFPNLHCSFSEASRISKQLSRKKAFSIDGIKDTSFSQCTECRTNRTNFHRCCI